MRRLLLLTLLLAGCTQPLAPTESNVAVSPSVSPTPSAIPTPSPNPSVALPAPGDCPTAGTAIAPLSAPLEIELTTPQGAIRLRLGTSNPIAAGNFAALVACGFYDGVVFHRIVPGFVIQGGDGEFGRLSALDPERVGTGGPGYTIADETVSETYRRGTVAMARSSAPNSQGSQFFIVLDDAAGGALAAYNTYAILGEVIAGMEVVDTIAALPQSGEPFNASTPLDQAPITRATIAE